MFSVTKFFGGFGAPAETEQMPHKESINMVSIAKLPTIPQAGTVQWLNDCIERGKDNAFSQVITVSPGLAAELLRRNPDNRSIRPVKAQQYATDMRSGNWVLNYEPIIVSTDGLLNDGQHRMQAVVDANCMVQMFFVFGASRESRETVDQGGARGASDYLGMTGFQNATVAATIARLVLAYHANDFRSIDARQITNAEVLSRARSDKAVAAAAHYAVSTGKRAANYCAGSMIGFCYYLFARIDEHDAKAFMDQICTGEGLKAGCAAIAVRERLLTVGKSRSQQAAVMFRGWNFYRRNMKVKVNSLPATMPLPALI